ncbi:hypothetical protein C7999DRAFT_38414 [Corynascus novoguineensis]|uniref:Uncharacterized protein n=1 Tax=Corynascus novoguineensis TaxID=1126955 RepID=A0AAN7CY55_9PEZI|nr:hypothetical protein C7999DRAFT_38414 [Corynascus novoguineensis]
MSGRRQIDRLPNVVNDVLVTTAKAFKAARRDGKANPAAAAAAMETRIPDAVERFNALLDDVESEILFAKAVLERELKLVRAKRQQPPPEQKPVAPPAPMVVDLESPKMAAKEAPTGLPGPPLSNAQASGTPASKPVAPFPNMGFESTSPEVAAVPNPKTAPKTNDPKSMVRPATAAAASTRPASAPPKKDVKAPPPQMNRSGGVVTAPQTPLNPSVQQPKPSSTPGGMNRQTPNSTPSNSLGATAAASSSPATGNNGLSADTTFSVAPTLADSQVPKQAPQPQRRASQQQLAPPGNDPSNPGAGGVSAPKVEHPTSGPADVANMDVEVQDAKGVENNSMANVDDKIDGLFDLGPGGIDSMDMEYDLGNGDNSNFNDMYFATGDNNGGSVDLDDFFNFNG